MTRTERADTVKYLTQDQVSALFRASKQFPIQDQVMLALMYRYGLRISEATGLQVRDVDLKRASIVVHGLKGGHTRTYSIGPDLLTLMRKHEPLGDYYLGSRQSDRLSRTQAWVRVKAVMEAAGIEGYGPHSLRHSVGVHLLDAGARLEAVKDQLRHRTIRSTEVYASLSPGARAEVAALMQRSSSIVKVR
jgi:integrase/recombinase XerD